MYLQSEQRLGATGLGLCVVPKEVTIRKLVCTDADLAAIGAEMGKGRGLVIREVRIALEDAVRRALVLIERAESQLKKPRDTGQAGDAMRQRFRDAFGTAPEFVPTWRPAGQTWDMGGVVRERLRCAAKIMSEGDIEFVAWGPGSCPFTFDWTKRLWAVVESGRFRICLGQAFWRAAGRVDTEGMATTLLHECLHIYFDTIRHSQEKWAYNVATCYERYVLLCSGIPIPPAVNVPCPSKIPAPLHGFLGAPPASFKKGGLPVGEDDAHHLLTILEGRSLYQPYLAKAMANRATTVPKKFLKIVTSVNSQVPKHLRRVFTSGGGRMTGGTIDRWTRTIYMVEAPGLRDHTRLEYALHECVHLFAHPHAPTQQSCPQPCIGSFQDEFGRGFGEGLTQVITEDIMDKQGISLNPHDRPYEAFAAVMRAVVTVFGIDAMARAYFFGDVASLRASMEARWGANNLRALILHTDAGSQKRVLNWIPVLEATYQRRMEAEEAQRKRLKELIQTSPRGDFPAPSRARPWPRQTAQEIRLMYIRAYTGFGDPHRQRRRARLF